MEAEIEEAREVIRRKNTIIANLENANTELNTRVTGLIRSLRETATLRAADKTQLQSSKAELNLAKEKIKRQEEHNAHMREEMSMETRRVTKLEERLCRLQEGTVSKDQGNAPSTLQEETLFRLRKENHRNWRIIAQQEDEAKIRVSAFRRLKDVNFQISKEKSVLGVECRRLKEALTAIERDQDACRAQLEASQEKNKTLTAENGTLMAQQRDLVTAYEEITEKYAAIVAETDGELEATKINLSVMEEENMKAQQANGNLIKEIEQYKDSLVSVQSSLETAESNLAVTEQAEREARELTNELRDQLEERNLQIATLQSLHLNPVLDNETLGDGVTMGTNPNPKSNEELIGNGDAEAQFIQHLMTEDNETGRTITDEKMLDYLVAYPNNNEDVLNSMASQPQQEVRKSDVSMQSDNKGCEEEIGNGIPAPAAGELTAHTDSPDVAARPEDVDMDHDHAATDLNTTAGKMTFGTGHSDSRSSAPFIMPSQDFTFDHPHLKNPFTVTAPTVPGNSSNWDESLRRVTSHRLSWNIDFGNQLKPSYHAGQAVDSKRDLPLIEKDHLHHQEQKQAEMKDGEDVVAMVSVDHPFTPGKPDVQSQTVVPPATPAFVPVVYNPSTPIEFGSLVNKGTTKDEISAKKKKRNQRTRDYHKRKKCEQKMAVQDKNPESDASDAAKPLSKSQGSEEASDKAAQEELEAQLEKLKQEVK